MSSSRLLVSGRSVTLELRCQAASLLETLEEVRDVDGDGGLDQAELGSAREAIGAYLATHYVLRANGGGAPEAGELLALRLVSLAPVSAETVVDDQAWVLATCEFVAAAPVRDLTIEVTLFAETSPEHRDLCELVFGDRPPVETLFWLGEWRRFYRAPEEADVASGPTAGAEAGTGLGVPAGTVGNPAAITRTTPGLFDWLRAGVGHIATGWDHVAFVLALVVAAGRLRSILGVVTAFTLAHSLTLALAALGLVSVPGRPVEVLIAVSIAWVGIANLFARGPVARWREAFGFGLVHGLGFAGFLAGLLSGEPRRLVPLVGFNLGVEAGQLVVVGLALLALAAVRRLGRGSAGTEEQGAPSTDAFLVPRGVRLAVSAAVAAAGLFWCVQRSGLAG